MVKVYDCPIIELPKISNRAGNITPIHSNAELPFDINRVFYLYDIPGGESRGAHARQDCNGKSKQDYVPSRTITACYVSF